VVGGKNRYHVTGIQWGGLTPRPAIEIRFDPGERFVPVENIPSTSKSWCFWSHEWSPPRTGKFTIRVRLNAANIAARRLNAGYYDRSVEIAEI
jgi:hypothetical protein